MAVISEYGSAKEVVMAVQEAVEQLERLLDSYGAVGDNDDRRSDDKEECPPFSGESKLNSPTTQLTILIDLYGSCKFCIGRYVNNSWSWNVAKQSRGWNCAESLLQTHLDHY